MSQVLNTSRPATKQKQFRPVLDVNILMRGQEEMLLRHDGRHYRLQITRRGKLILTGHEDF